MAHLIHHGWRHPWRLGRWTHHQMHHYIQRICTQYSIDVVHLAWTEMGRYIDAIPRGSAIVLHTLDVERQVRPREIPFYQTRRSQRQATSRMHRLIEIEQYATTRADVVLASSASDCDNLCQIAGHDRIYVITPWIGEINDTPVQSTPGRLTFMGAMDRIANIAAARFLIHNVWPHVRHPDATLQIVGAHPPSQLFQETKSPIVVTGFRENLSEVWGETDIAVSPSLIGGGLLVKVAQPMLAGRPVITTSLGNEGLGAPIDQAVAIADTPQAFANAIDRLLANRIRRQSIAACGQTFVKRHFNWDKNLDNLEKAYQIAVRHAKEK